MSMLSLERRRSNPKAIYAACMIGLSIGIPVLILAPKFLEARQGTVIQSHDRCFYGGQEHSIMEVDGDRYQIIHFPTMTKKWVDRSDIVRHPGDVPSEYHWYLSLFP